MTAWINQLQTLFDHWIQGQRLVENKITQMTSSSTDTLFLMRKTHLSVQQSTDLISLVSLLFLCIFPPQSDCCVRHNRPIRWRGRVRHQAQECSVQIIEQITAASPCPSPFSFFQQIALSPSGIKLFSQLI